ncbi:MAG: primosomal protein N' [Oscillospiraceae bacterium]|nr:primosomal protein N' [Oscillospiraceae bacterium]
MTPAVARIHILDAPYHMDKGYDYHIPADLRGQVLPGMLAFVPFGLANKSRVGVVSEVLDLPADGLKPISALHDNPSARLSPHLLALCHYIRDNNFCALGEVVKCALPFGISFAVNEVYTINPQADREGLNASAAVIFDYVKLHGRVSSAQVVKEFDRDALAVLRSLTEAEVLVRQHISKDKAKTQFEQHISLTPQALSHIAANTLKLRSAVHQQIIDYLFANGTTPVSLLRAEYKITAAHIKALDTKGYIEITSSEVIRRPAPIGEGGHHRAVLSDKQQSAVDTLTTLYDSDGACAALLHGVTGSGKTIVIMETIRHVLASGKSVIVLVPEIALTPQTIAHFTATFGENIAVLHSALSSGERYDQWRMIQSGQVQICIGTRSAVFAPFDSLGLIVIDEEQEHTYKSDSAPHYHARDAARFRCANAGAMLLLASATPSVESYYKATTGAYTLVSLDERFGNATLPQVSICDMRGSLPTDIVGEELGCELAANIERGEQSIMFVNRRGFNTLVSCADCGTAVSCRRCSVSMTLHVHRGYREREQVNASFDTHQPKVHNSQKQSGVGLSPPALAGDMMKRGRLCCHYCGVREPIPQKCAACESGSLQFLGFGTQLAEERLNTLHPNAGIIRVDADTTGGKHSVRELLEQFRNSGADIMLGTQMVTKGHDFPKVTLVGVLLADSSLYMDDYRANERTFALLTQVIGRAGRAELPGRAVIQTYNPDHPILALASAQDYVGFFGDEIAFRRALLFPPFCDIVLISLSSVEEAALRNVCGELDIRMKELLRGEYSDIAVTAFGPLEAPIYRLNERYRMRFVVKCKAGNRRTREMLSRLLIEFGRKTGRKISISMDVNPSNI